MSATHQGRDEESEEAGGGFHAAILTQVNESERAQGH